MFSNIFFSIRLSDIFEFPPSFEPVTLHPPSGSTPFHIPPEIYTSALDLKVPVTIATLYLISVFFLNKYNTSHQNQPWSISKYKLFDISVIIHNVLLILFSGWTFLGMWGTIQRSVSSPRSNDGLVGTVDSLCKIHGLRGLGRSFIYNSTISQWTPQTPSLYLDESGILDLASPGRMWNEGLAFYGWLFYLSKFYEVIDTLIIIVKGKKSGVLQTFHHAGAMFCMWSGIRFMSPPIWMFVFVNSAIHSLMYTYYSINALKLPVSQYLKKLLTILQITQLAVGILYAANHSFISYLFLTEIPIIETIIDDSVSATTPPLSSTTATPKNLAQVIKKLLIFSLGASDVVKTETTQPKYIENVTYKTLTNYVTCLDTSGQNFAIWLNVLYLIPLIGLFLRFFSKSYRTKNTKSRSVGEIEIVKNLPVEKESNETNENKI
ncbi:putative fatty acid elongase [Golovinomyces cichoracearum]|uniref:Elongation of fatty acids protein n=1 Tax=Golovinomyces cichoracearum TaxID=62708 RepID=A0A420IXX9_9PEZI|nr:putative fatty acid elongase [Golovinomyces cichoracearum]